MLNRLLAKVRNISLHYSSLDVLNNSGVLNKTINKQNKPTILFRLIEELASNGQIYIELCATRFYFGTKKNNSYDVFILILKH